MSRRHSLNAVSLPPRLLSDLSTERLSKLNEDDVEFTEFLDSLKLDDLQRTQNKRQEITDANFQKAVVNAEKESDFEDKKAQLRLKVLDMIDLRNDHDEKYEELKSLTCKTDQEAVLKNLRQALRETEKNSEELADKFMGGKSDMNVDLFTDEIQKQRALYWLRKVKAEKMEELLKNLRPVAAPRSPRNARAHANPPYLAPMPPHQSNPAHSLPPTSHATPYPPDPRRPSDPGQSMPPYPPATSRMPQPPSGHPFPSAAFSYYRPPGQPYPSRPPGPNQPYPPRPPAQPYARPPPPKPSPYGSYNPNYYHR